MNCDFVKDKIYEAVYSNIKQLDDEISRHIGDCPDCNSYFEDCQSAQKISSLLNQKQPGLNNPQKLTNDILDSLNELEPEKQSEGFKIFNTVKRFLVAASAGLIITFGYEQYVVFEKMIKLEEQMLVVTKVPVNSSYYLEMLSSFPDQGVELIKSELASMGLESRDEELKSLFMKADFGILSHDAILKRLQDQLVHLKISGKDMGIINTILEKE